MYQSDQIGLTLSRMLVSTTQLSSPGPQVNFPSRKIVMKEPGLEMRQIHYQILLEYF